MLGQVKTAAKSNEITAIPELIELLDINGALVSTDAMGCQTDIAQHIVDKGGDYLFTLKSNHKKLHSAVVAAFAKEREMADAVRAHWSVENSLHWVLDVSLREDDCQIHQNHGAENWSMLRHMALNMLRAESSKGSIPAKQKRV